VFALNEPGALPQAPVEEGDTWYVFKLKSRERADLSKLDANEKKTVRERLEQQKQGELYSAWIEQLRKKANIVENESVLSYETGAAHEAYSPDDF
jgi:parvulin-like peptidyl-prolyl isomerase